jgi:hypothetical protein
MAHARRLIVMISALAAAAMARAAGPCEEGRGQTGLAVAATAPSGLAVAAIDPDSPAATSGLAIGDAVMQVNDSRPRSCGEWARAVRDARGDRKALLLLVERGGAERPLVLGAASWDRAVAIAAPPPPPTEAPTVRALVAAPPPRALPPETTVTLEEVQRGLAALADAARPSARLAGYRKELVRLEGQVESLAARRSAPPAVVDGLRTVLRYYDAAAVAWASDEARREQQRQPRHVPSPDGAAAPYFEDSQVAAAIEEFPFLRETVVRDPRPGLLAGESAGLWRPLQARALLWERGHDELSRLTAWLAAGT